MDAQLVGNVATGGARGGHQSQASYRPAEVERSRLSDRSAGWDCGERVSARRIPCKDSTCRPRRAGRSHHCNRRLCGSLWIHAILCAAMFFLNENLWLTMTLMISLVAIVLTTFVIVGWRRDA